MKRSTLSMLFGAAALAVPFFVLLEQAAEAARLGGGKSFGSRPSYQRSAPLPSPSPSPAAPRPGAAQPAVSPQPAFGGFGGMLGGILMGGLIGSLLFGGGHAWGGPGLLDLVVFGGGLYLLFRLLRARRTAPAGGGLAGPPAFTRGEPDPWGIGGGTSAAAQASSPAYPEGFDAEEFLKGARLIYNRLQASWDRRDLEDIRAFTTPEVFEEIRRQAEEDPRPGKTDILLVHPEIQEVREIDGKIVVSVLYDAMLREEASEAARPVRELWHFSRDAKGGDSFWKLEGIQQAGG
ncbi:MAG: Tim44-like domain-containing protein [Desulfobacterales bacterium]